MANGDELLTSVCLCTYVKTPKRLEDLRQVLWSMRDNLRAPCEVVIVDDVSPLFSEVSVLVENFIFMMAQLHPEIAVRFMPNEKNMGHPRSQNRSMDLAMGSVLIHIEDDICVDHVAWNRIFAKCLADHPEVGQVLPNASGRGEWIPRPGYDEFMWGLGGVWAVRREVYEKVGGWDPALSHQIEPDYNLRVRMDGWRLAQIKDFAMNHLGEGDEADTFERQAMIHVGVYNFLKKWNRRFFGTYSYREIWTMSPDDFPPNVAFRRQLAAWFAAQAKKLTELLANPNAALTDQQRANIKSDIDVLSKCRLNEKPEPFQYPGHWGNFVVVKLIRPPGREREDELIEKMGSNYVFKDIPQLHQQIKDLSIRMGKNLTDEQVAEYLKEKEVEFLWDAKIVRT